MTWVVEATYGVGTVSREFGSLVAARSWEIGMTCAGWETTRPVPVDGGRHLKVINGGRGETSQGSKRPGRRGRSVTA